MNLEERKQDLFTVRGDWYYAHCIASDLKMGAGIAVPMQRKFGMRSTMQLSGEDLDFPTCILTRRVFNLITKAKSRGKPTYESLRASLEVMRDIVQREDIKQIAMPKIGCGLDRLSWPKVREMLGEVFEDIDVKFLVCHL